MPAGEKPNTALGWRWISRYHRAAVAMDLESSFELLQKAKDGDGHAQDRLLARYRPRLFRWTSGRLPGFARDFTDTEDIVQLALIGFVRNVDHFVYEGEWSVQAYLRKAAFNEIRAQIRRRGRLPTQTEMPEDVASTGLCPYEQAVGAEVFARYNAALEQLTPVEQEAVIAKVELGCSDREVMLLVDKPSPDAARMFVSRALAKLAKLMAASLDNGSESRVG